jgi:hypothetical protein
MVPTDLLSGLVCTRPGPCTVLVLGVSTFGPQQLGGSQLRLSECENNNN